MQKFPWSFLHAAHYDILFGYHYSTFWLPSGGECRRRSDYYQYLVIESKFTQNVTEYAKTLSRKVSIFSSSTSSLACSSHLIENNKKNVLKKRDIIQCRQIFVPFCKNVKKRWKNDGFLMKFHANFRHQILRKLLHDFVKQIYLIPPLAVLRFSTDNFCASLKKKWYMNQQRVLLRKKNSETLSCKL